MSHNWRNYNKKLRKSDAKDQRSIQSFFSSSQASGSTSSTVETEDAPSISEPHSPENVSPQDQDSTEGETVSESDPVSCPEPESISTEAEQQTTSATEKTDQTKTKSPESPPHKRQCPESDFPANVKEKSSPHDSRQFYEAKYQSRFQWLYYSHVKNGYMCKYCELFAPPSQQDEYTPYVTCGAVLATHPSRRLETHDTSKCHQIALDKYKLTIRPPKPISVVMSEKHPRSKEVAARNKRYIKKVFKTCMFVAKKNWALMNIPDIVKFIGEAGDDEVKTIIDEKVNYLSSTSVTEIIQLISSFIEREILDELRGKKFTLFADESTDVSNRTQFSIFVRYIKKSVPVEQYLGLINVERTTSQALMEALETFCIGKGIDMGLIRFVAFDGCNTMSGDRKGLQRRIRNVSPLSIYINCRNHRLALCFVHLLKKIDLLADVEALLVAIWKVFHFSPKRAAVFKNVQDMYDQRPLNFVRAAATRWLSHLKACVRFIGRYETLLDTFDSMIESNHEPDIQGIRASMARKDVVATALVLIDVLKPVNFLSLYLQEDCGTFTQLPVRVKSCIDDMEAIIQQYEQQNYEGLEFSKCQHLFEVIDERTTFARRLRHRGQPELAPEVYLRQHGIPLIYGLIGEINDAFSTPDPVLRAFSLLEPNNLPDNIADIPNYGKEAARTLADFYGSEKVDVFEGHRTVVPPDVEAADLIYDQLLDFRRPMFMYKNQGHDTAQKVMDAVANDPSSQLAFPVMQDMLGRLLLIPQSTALVERGFSLMNNIATELRTLSQSTLDALMRISIYNGEVDYDRLVELFKAQKAREMDL